MAAMTPIVVSGATGNVGRELVRTLADAGHVVRALVTDPLAASRGALAVEADRVSFVQFSFTDPSTFVDAFVDATDLFLMRPPAIGDADVIVRAVEAAHGAGVCHIAFLSIQGAEHNPVVPHHAIERHLKRVAAADTGFAYTFLRAAFFMQNLSTTHAADIRELDEIWVPAGGGRTAFVDARDVAAAAARVLTDPVLRTHANRAYELTSRDALTYDEVAAILTRVLNRPIVYRHPGALRFYRHMRRRGISGAHAAVMVALYTAVRLGLADHLSGELEELLGRATIGFTQFASTYAWAWQVDLPSDAEL